MAEASGAFVFRRRGSVDVKGIGPVATAFLIGPRGEGLKASA